MKRSIQFGLALQKWIWTADSITGSPLQISDDILLDISYGMVIHWKRYCI